MGQPGAPSERMDCWVVAQDEADARAQAEAKFPGQQFKLQQVGCLLPSQAAGMAQDGWGWQLQCGCLMHDFGPACCILDIILHLDIELVQSWCLRLIKAGGLRVFASSCHLHGKLQSSTSGPCVAIAISRFCSTCRCCGLVAFQVERLGGVELTIVISAQLLT